MIRCYASRERIKRVFDVLGLKEGVAEQTEVVHTQADDLDHAARAQRVVHQDELIDKAEDKEGEEQGDCVAAGHLDYGGLEAALDGY